MKRIAPIDIAGGILVVAFLALLPMFAASNYLTGVLTVCVIYGIWASSCVDNCFSTAPASPAIATLAG